MTEILLFEIPVYPWSKEEFDKKWKIKNSKLVEEMTQHGHSNEDAEKISSQLSFPNRLWRYNQIVGYITITVTKQDVFFDLYCTMDKRFYFDTKTKHFIQNMGMLGTHFPIDAKTNAEIKIEIQKWLKIIQNERLKRFYVDYSVFDTVFEHTDIRAIVDEIV